MKISLVLIITQRRLQEVEKKSIESEVAKITPQIESIDNLVDALTTTFKSFSDEDLPDSTIYAVNYLFDNHKSIGLSEINLLEAINQFYLHLLMHLLIQIIISPFLYQIFLEISLNNFFQ